MLRAGLRRASRRRRRRRRRGRRQRRRCGCPMWMIARAPPRARPTTCSIAFPSGSASASRCACCRRRDRARGRRRSARRHRRLRASLPALARARRRPASPACRAPSAPRPRRRGTRRRRRRAERADAAARAGCARCGRYSPPTPTPTLAACADADDAAADDELAPFLRLPVELVAKVVTCLDADAPGAIGARRAAVGAASSRTQRASSSSTCERTYTVQARGRRPTCARRWGGSWRAMFTRRPRVRTNGCYGLRMSFGGAQLDMWTTARFDPRRGDQHWLECVQFRYLRFYDDGDVPLRDGPRRAATPTLRARASTRAPAAAVLGRRGAPSPSWRRGRHDRGRRRDAGSGAGGGGGAAEASSASTRSGTARCSSGPAGHEHRLRTRTTPTPTRPRATRAGVARSARRRRFVRAPARCSSTSSARTPSACDYIVLPASRTAHLSSPAADDVGFARRVRRAREGPSVVGHARLRVCARLVCRRTAPSRRELAQDPKKVAPLSACAEAGRSCHGEYPT